METNRSTIVETEKNRLRQSPKKVLVAQLREAEAFEEIEEDGADAQRLMAARRFLRR